MKNLFYLLAIIINIISLPIASIAQIRTPKVEDGNSKLYVRSIDFSENNEGKPSFVKGELVLFKDSVSFVKLKVNKLISEEKDELGYTHLKWQQTINSIPVEDAIYIQHTISGKLTSENGQWIQDTTKFQKPSGTISFTEIIKTTLRYVGAKKYRWQVAEEEKSIKEVTNDSKATFYPQPVLV